MGDFLEVRQNPAGAEPDSGDGLPRKRKSESLPTPDSVAVGKEDSLKSLPEGTEYWETWGWIEQHLRDGYILYKGAGPNHVLEHFAVLYPGAENLSDGTQIKFKACYAGTYQYTTVVGSTNTIDKLLYLTPEMLPKPKPGAWMWERHGALSQ